MAHIEILNESQGYFASVDCLWLFIHSRFSIRLYPHVESCITALASAHASGARGGGTQCACAIWHASLATDALYAFWPVEGERQDLLANLSFDRAENLNSNKETSLILLIDTANLNGTTYRLNSLQAEAWPQKSIASYLFRSRILKVPFNCVGGYIPKLPQKR